jgi:hypothetical protein
MTEGQPRAKYLWPAQKNHSPKYIFVVGIRLSNKIVLRQPVFGSLQPAEQPS